MADKLKMAITSDGTPAGTSLKINGEDITGSKNVVRMSMYATGGATWSEYEKSPGRVELDFTVVTKDGAKSTWETYTYNIDQKDMPARTPIGQPDSEVSDALVGRDPELVTKIMAYKKPGVYIPEREVLLGRTQDSLKDMLQDLEATTDGN